MSLIAGLGITGLLEVSYEIIHRRYNHGRGNSLLAAQEPQATATRRTVLTKDQVHLGPWRRVLSKGV